MFKSFHQKPVLSGKLVRTGILTRLSTNSIKEKQKYKNRNTVRLLIYIFCFICNIFKEIKADIGTDAPATGNLTRWAEQGVLLLNATLTVRAHQAGSHQNRGWETFTDAAIRALAEEKENLVFILWGSYAQKKGAFIDRNKHLVLTSAHPSPLSAYNGFFGNKHFSRTNDYLKAHGETEIAW